MAKDAGTAHSDCAPDGSGTSARRSWCIRQNRRIAWEAASDVGLLQTRRQRSCQDASRVGSAPKAPGSASPASRSAPLASGSWASAARADGERLGLGVSGILCAGPVAPSRLNEAFVEHDGELGLCLAPLARRHFPFSCGRAQDQIQELRRGVIGWKMTSRAHGTGNFALSASMALVV